MLKPLTPEEQAAHLRTIAHEAQRLRDLAHLADASMTAFLLENLLHEVRAELGKRGMPTRDEVSRGADVVKLK